MKNDQTVNLCRDVALFLAILLASYNLATRTTDLEAKVQHLERAQALYHAQYEDAAEILRTGAGMLNEAKAREKRTSALEARADGQILPVVGESFAEWVK